jgi:predicted DNA binding CopG/RHH family protein
MDHIRIMKTSSCFIRTRISEETKRIVESIARDQQLTEAAWLRRLIHTTLQSAGAHARPAAKDHSREARTTRLRLRIRPDDLVGLQARASARGMPTATYLSVLVRSHLHALSPLPEQELLALKRSIAELRALGKNINQLARAANAGHAVGVRREELMAILRACEALRDHVHALLKANLESWESGFETTQD